MNQKTQELAKKLRKYSKEQIIEAISKCYQADYILDKLLSDLEYAAQNELLVAHAVAIDAERVAAYAYMDWQMEMCDKYGHDGKYKFADIPPKEITKGANLEQMRKDAQAKEQTLNKKVNKMLLK